jgi:hypothetical protein
MMTKHCPHCLKRIPFRKRFRARCPFCFKTFRRRSGSQERGVIGLWLEDRNTTFWFFILTCVLVLAAITMQVFGNPDLLNFIDHHYIWFFISIFFLAMYGSVVSRIYFPLLLDAPRIMRVERAAIHQYKVLTTIGLLLGIPFAMVFVGVHGIWESWLATAFLFVIPVTLLWAYHALTLTEEDYDDQRVWSYLQELGLDNRLEHRHHAYMVLVGIPLAAGIFFYFLAHPWLANMIKESIESGLISMFRELWQRTGGRGR